MERYLNPINRIYESEQQYRFYLDCTDREARFDRFLEVNDLTGGETTATNPPRIMSKPYTTKAGPQELCKWAYANARKYCRKCMDCKEHYR